MGHSFRTIAIRAQDRRWNDLLAMAATGDFTDAKGRSAAVSAACRERRQAAGLADAQARLGAHPLTSRSADRQYAIYMRSRSAGADLARKEREVA